MKSARVTVQGVSMLRGARTIGLIWVLAGSATAQGIQGSISTVSVPGSPAAVFDSERNLYSPGGSTVTAGAAQTQAGGGVCNFPIRGGIPFPGNCRDTGIVKADPSGNVIWATLLGGATDDTGTDIALDAAGNVYITGSTGGQFPTTPGVAYGSNAPSAVFAAKVTSDGSRFVYVTYLPLATSSVMVVDGGGNAYVAGNNASGHTVVVKVSPDGSAVLYNVVLAGNGKEGPTAIAVDLSGNILVAGQTTSTDFPVTLNAPQRRLKGTQNSFLVKLDPTGTIQMSTYLGGSGVDTPTALAVDGAGNIDIAGVTSSLDFPTTPGTFQPSPIVPMWNNYAPAGFVAQLSPDGTTLKWASYVMSSDVPNSDGLYIGIGVREMAVTQAGDIYLVGLTGPGFPVTSSAPEACYRGTGFKNGFLARLNSQGRLLDATYVGRSEPDGLNLIGPVAPMAGNAAWVLWHGSGDNSLSKVQFGGDGWTVPACLSENILNAASQSAGSGVAPGEIVTLTGLGIGPEIGLDYQPDAQGNIPTLTAGVQVLFDGVPAPVMYAQSRQINAIAPAGLKIDGTTNVSVRYNGRTFGPVTVPVTFGSPGIFRLQPGESAQAVAINQDGTLNGPAHPAPRGSFVAMWGTGYGSTNPPCVVGGLNQPRAEPLRTGVTALLSPTSPEVLNPIGRIMLRADYAGSAPTLPCGVVQINFQVPANATPGTYFFEPSIQFVDPNVSLRGYSARIGATVEVK
ncbi:MAG: SBBP repeat-containing protein [Bryobacteraceae bacterium]